MDRMVAEYRMLRFSTHLHPLAAVRDVLPKNITTSDKLVDLPEGSTVTLAGIVVARQRPGTAKGFVFVLMEDEAGLINIIVKPKVYEKCKAVVRMEPFITARGRLQRDGLTINVIAYEIDALRSAQNTPDLPDTMEYWGEPDDPGMVARGGLPSDEEAVQEGFKRAGRGDMARTIR